MPLTKMSKPGKRWWCHPCHAWHYGECPLEKMGAHQTEIFDLLQGEEARDEAIEQVRRAHAEWANDALLAVKGAAQELSFFTTDDVWQRGLRRPTEARAMGPVMIEAMRRGWIIRTGQTRRSVRVKAHANPKQVWRSLLRDR